MEISFGLGTAALFLAIAWYSIRKLQHTDPVDRLERLSRLHQDGILDDEEFEIVKKRQIKRIKWD